MLCAIALCSKCSSLNGKIIELKFSVLKQNLQPPFHSQLPPQTKPFWAARGTTLIRTQAGTNLWKYGIPKVHLVVSSSKLKHFPRETRVQLGIKLPDQHTKPDLKHNITKTGPRVLQNAGYKHSRPTPHGAAGPSSCAAMLPGNEDPVPTASPDPLWQSLLGDSGLSAPQDRAGEWPPWGPQF